MDKEIVVETKLHLTPTNQTSGQPAINETKAEDKLYVSVVDDVSEKIESELLKLREASSLRKLRNLESGQRIREVNSGTYFFTLTGWLGGINLKRESFDRIEVNLLKTYMYDFEVHKSTSSELYIVGFMTKSDAQRLSSNKNGSIKNLLISSNHIEGFTSLVKVPVRYITDIDDRNVATTESNEVKVLEFDYQS